MSPSKLGRHSGPPLQVISFRALKLGGFEQKQGLAVFDWLTVFDIQAYTPPAMFAHDFVHYLHCLDNPARRCTYPRRDIRGAAQPIGRAGRHCRISDFDRHGFRSQGGSEVHHLPRHA